MSLTKSERVKLMKAIADELDPESWNIINLTLDQFGLVLPEDYEGNSKGYILRSVKDATDTQLIELAIHLGIAPPPSALSDESSEPTYKPPTGKIQDATFRVFLSHLSAHQRFVGQLQLALAAYGIDSFVAHKDVEPTEEWMDVIERELRTCDALIALLHPGFHKSQWTDQEIGFAMGRGKPAFAITFGEAPYGFIGRFQAFVGGEKQPPQIALELVNKFMKHPSMLAGVARVMTKKFGRSRSFADSVRMVGWLEKLAYWDANMIAYLKLALEKNDQISNERIHDVPGRLETLIEKWSKSKPQPS